MERLDVRAVVGRGLWLASETEAVREAVLDAMTLRRHVRGERIYDPEGGPTGLFGIAAGTVRLEIAAGLEDPGLFALATPGFVLANLTPPAGLASAVTAVAGNACLLLAMPSARLATLVREVPAVEGALTRLATLNLWTVLRIVSTLRRQCNLERLADLLVTLAGADLADGWRIEVPQADLAAMAALGRTTLVATLRRLEDLGLVAAKYRGIVLRDAEGLVARRDGTGGAARRGAAAQAATRTATGAEARSGRHPEGFPQARRAG